MPAAPDAIPVKPKIPAITEITANIKAHFNITVLLYRSLKPSDSF
jgi:hypothetical protein